MTNLESTPTNVYVEELRSTLLENYQEIDSRARGMILDGNAIGNPPLSSEMHDKRYSMALLIMLNGPADAFLGDSISKILEVEPEMAFNRDGFRHIAIRDLNYNPEGRKEAQVDAKEARKYYSTLRDAFKSPQGSFDLELVRIIPAIDREQDSVSIVGAFLPKDDKLLNLRTQVQDTLGASNLSLSSRLGQIRVLFSTLGRLPNPPRRIGDSIPLLDKLDEINSQIQKGITTSVESVEMVSASPIGYIWADKVVYLSPPISMKEENNEVAPRFITPNQRLHISEQKENSDPLKIGCFSTEYFVK